MHQTICVSEILTQKSKVESSVHMDTPVYGTKQSDRQLVLNYGSKFRANHGTLVGTQLS